MPGSYIPPHLRNKAPNAGSQASETTLTEDRFTLEEIYEHFWEINGADETDGRRPYTSESLSRTLHGSKRTPDKLAFVILFEGANPRWDTDRVIFTKSNMDLLPKVKSDNEAKESFEKLEEEVSGKGAPLASSGEVETSGQPIAIFKQQGLKQRNQMFKFDGWYKITLIDILAPKSPELVRMLEQKWTKNKGGKMTQEARSSESWQRSLSLRWAVVKFVKDEDAEKERGLPKIEGKPEQPT